MGPGRRWRGRPRGRRRLPWLLLAAPGARSEYFPHGLLHGRQVADWRTTWQAPQLQPWEELRATAASITVAWTPGWNPLCAVARYELDMRRPAGAPLRFADLEGVQHREADVEEEAWPGDGEWLPWQRCFGGPGRVYTLRVEPGRGGYAVQFRVRACGACGALFQDGCSAWSKAQTTHTVLSAAVDMINFYIRGTGRNNPDYTIIEVNRETIYQRRDETGLVLAIFSRLDFSLQWLRTYDTHRDRNASLQMSRDVRQFNQSFFVMVASTIAWEWHAARTLAQTMEYCGAYHFGQWAHTFAEQPHYASSFSDLQQTASQEEFGHPFAFLGIPGLGAGMGWESLMHNTGHYVASGLKAQQAIIRGIFYFDYTARLFRAQDVATTKAEFYEKSSAPEWETLHNPVPERKKSSAPHSISKMLPVYTPYIGTMQIHITRLLEANGTVPPHNFAFALVTDAGVRKADPRPRRFWLTELERVWSGASARYWLHNGTLLLPGIPMDQRNCREFVAWGYNFASPESCGADFAECCPQIDEPGLLVTSCGVGVSPTLCKNAVRVMAENTSALNSTRWPYPFRVIDWVS